MINKASTNVTKKESKVSDKVKTIVNSYASVNIRIIDVATTQIKFADTFEGRASSSIETVASNMVKRQVGNIIVEVNLSYQNYFCFKNSSSFRSRR